MVTANDVIRTRVQAIIRGAHIIKEWDENGMHLLPARELRHLLLV